MASTKESATGKFLLEMRWVMKAGPIKKEHAFNMLFFSSLYSMSISQRLFGNELCLAISIKPA